MQSTVSLLCSQPYHLNFHAGCQPCRESSTLSSKYVKFSMKALIPHQNDLKTAFQTVFLFSAFPKCEKKLEIFFLFRLKVKFLDLPNLDKTIPNAFSKMLHGIKGRFS